MPKVSVIIPCFNYGKYLAEALESLINQTFPDWECIIVNNLSTDNTHEIAQKFVEKDDRFQYTCCDVKGVSAARNSGIKKSSGEYILPLDADDKIGPEYLSKAVEFLDSNPAVKVVYCEAELFGEASGKWHLPEYSFKGLLMENLIFCSAFFRRTDFDNSKGYNEEMLTGFEDWDFWLELLKNGGGVFKLPSVQFYYRIRKASRNNSLNLKNIKLIRQQIYNNHKELYSQNLNMSDILFEYFVKKEALRKIENSKEHTLGKILLAPFRKLKSFLRF